MTESTHSAAQLRRVFQECSEMSFDQAQSIVRPIGALLEEKRFRRSPFIICAEDLEPSDSSFYSKSNLTCSKARAVAAFKTYFVLVPDEQSASAAMFVLNGWIACVIPDQWEEPILSDDFQRLQTLQDALLKSLAEDMETLKFIRAKNSKGEPVYLA